MSTPLTQRQEAIRMYLAEVLERAKPGEHAGWTTMHRIREDVPGLGSHEFKQDLRELHKRGHIEWRGGWANRRTLAGTFEVRAKA